MIVLDASAAVAGLLGHAEARRYLADVPVHVPHLIDCEIASALRRQSASGAINADIAAAAIVLWSQLGVFRYPVVGLLERIWELRANVTAYDATYVALAELLRAPLVTLDARVATAPGIRCEVAVLARN
jgi:predicted nucleic acid-binding protein